MNEQSPHTDIVNDWIIGYLTNSLTPEEMQSLQNWLNVSEENRKHFPICKKYGSLLLMKQMNSISTKNRLINYFRAYGKPCATIGKTKNTHYQSVDVCRCNGCNCFFCGMIAFQSGKRVLRNQLTQITVEAPYGSKPNCIFLMERWFGLMRVPK